MRRSLLACALVLCAACGEKFLEPQPGEVVRDVNAHFQTDSLEYGMLRGPQEYEAVVEMTYTNRRTDTVYVANCGGSTAVALERRMSGKWKTAWTPTVLPCLSAPIVIPPGSSRRFHMRVGAGVPGGPVEPRWPYADVNGLYRIVWGQFLSSYREGRNPLGAQLPGAQRVSNEFRLVLRSRPNLPSQPAP